MSESPARPPAPSCLTTAKQEVFALQSQLANLGIALFIGEDRLLHARPAASLTPALRKSIKAWKGILLAELLVAETLEWERSSWGWDDRFEINLRAPSDLLERRSLALYGALSATGRGDVEDCVTHLKKYRNVQRAAAKAAGLREVSFPENPPEYPPRKESDSE